jgi:hypothetical protein
MSVATKKAPSFVKGKKATPSPDKLEALKAMVREYRNKQHSVNLSLVEISETQRELTEMKKKTIPEFMEKVQVPSITVDPEVVGNVSYPAFTAERKPFYSANIAADWPPTLKEQAFAYVEKMGYGELMKTFVTFAFPRDLQPAVVPFLKACKSLKLVAVVEEVNAKGKKVKRRREFDVPVPEVEKTIHSGTLTKWLREQVENEGNVPDLDKIGGFVGTVAEIKEVKEKKPRANRPQPAAK